MSIYLKPNLFVTISQMDGEFAPRPLPLNNGFSLDLQYEVLGIHTASESAEAFLILCNDRKEMWFISNRHCRIVTETLAQPMTLSIVEQLEKVPG